MPRPSIATGISTHPADAVKRSHINDQEVPMIGQGAEEPKTMDTTDLEADDIVIACAVKIFLHNHLTQSLQVSWVQQVPERAR